MLILYFYLVSFLLCVRIKLKKLMAKSNVNLKGVNQIMVGYYFIKIII